MCVALGRMDVLYFARPQETLQDNDELAALEKEVMQHLLDVNEEAERLRADLDRFSPLWQSHKRGVMQEFLTYGRRLKDGEEDVDESPPMLADFQREVNATCVTSYVKLTTRPV